MLCVMHKLKDEKHHEKLFRKIRLLQDNATVHTVVSVKATIQTYGFQEINYQPYNLDLIEVESIRTKIYKW